MIELCQEGQLLPIANTYKITLSGESLKMPLCWMMQKQVEKIAYECCNKS